MFVSPVLSQWRVGMPMQVYGIIWGYYEQNQRLTTSMGISTIPYGSLFFPCAGKAGCWASPVCRCAILLRQFRTVDRGCQPAPGLPCALFQLRVNDEAKLGRASREDAKVCLRSGMRMEARRCHPQTPSLRAQRSNPVCRRGKILECFAALEMTRMMEVPGAEIAKLLAAFSQRASRAA